MLSCTGMIQVQQMAHTMGMRCGSLVHPPEFGAHIPGAVMMGYGCGASSGGWLVIMNEAASAGMREVISPFSRSL